MCFIIMLDNVIGINIALSFVFWVAFLPGQARHLTNTPVLAVIYDIHIYSLDLLPFLNL
jgi:hypothetical protein